MEKPTFEDVLQYMSHFIKPAFRSSMKPNMDCDFAWLNLKSHFDHPAGEMFWINICCAHNPTVVHILRQFWTPDNITSTMHCALIHNLDHKKEAWLGSRVSSRRRATRCVEDKWCVCHSIYQNEEDVVFFKMVLLAVWHRNTPQQAECIARLPLELIRMICEFI